MIDSDMMLEILTLIGARGGHDDKKLDQIAHNVTRRYVLAGKITKREAEAIKEYLSESR